MNVVRRPATLADLAFARELYLEPMRDISASLFEWNEQRQIERFDTMFVPEETTIFTLGSEDIGWYQLGVNDDEIFLKQFFVCKERRGQGIGTASDMDSGSGA